MPPLFWALLLSFAVSGLLCIAWVAALDRSDARKPIEVAPPTPTINHLPRAVAIPTVHRRKHPGRWPL